MPFQKRQFVSRSPGYDRVLLPGDQVVELIAPCALQLVRHAGWIAHIVDWLAVGIEFYTLKPAGQETTAPLARSDGLIAFATTNARQHHKAGQIFRFGLKP